MARISDETVLEVKRALDIVEVVQGYFPLKRAGANYKARCPFHEEKTPSFNVHPEKQIYKCFGCGKAGDVITFVMEFEKVDYPEAIRLLADKAGVPVKIVGESETGIDRREIYRANEWAAGVFRGLLKNAPEAAVAREFLARRGVNDETAELFGLGYSMDSWDHLLQRGRQGGFSDKLLHAAGLAVERESKNGFYDRFRGRLIFPISDPRGKTIAFGARTLKDEQPKFINSPETAIFSKGRGFYGLNLAREELAATGTIHIVEGYLDVIVPFQAGVRGLVATMGTALGSEHLKVLGRYDVNKVVLVFDADAAGQKASERGLDLLLTERMDLFIAELPAGMDPDDVVLKEGPDRLRQCLEKPREIFDFLMASLTAKHGAETPAAKGRIVEELLERLARIPDDVKRELLLQQVAARFGVEPRTLRGRLETLLKPAPAAAAVPAPEPVPAAVTAARELLACAVADPAVAARLRREAPVERYPEGPLRAVAEQAYAMVDRTGEVSGRDLMALLQDPAARTAAAEALALDVPREGAAARAQACLEALASAEYRTESRDRRARLKNASPEEEADLLRQLMEARRKRPSDHGLLPGR